MKMKVKLEEASTHTSAKTHAGNVFVIPGLDLFDLFTQNKWVSRIHRGTVLSQVCDPYCISFEILCRKKDRQKQIK